jgi:alkylation response protein AidB-like acyl-CoA dehydrogenase
MTNPLGDVPNPVELRDAIQAWFKSGEDRLAPFRAEPPGSMEDQIEHERVFVRHLYEGGWTRYGWPVSSGGFGGTALHRGVVYEEILRAGYVLPHVIELLETLGPVLTRFSPALADEHLPTYLAGDVLWGQGFSEPDAGSDLASLRTRATDEGDHYLLNGQKIWTTLGHLSSYAMVLARTGAPDSAHRGLSMLWVDLHAPGVLVRPITAANGLNEFAEMFFDGVVVPKEHLIGDEGAGWGVAMYLLQYERGMYAWMRQSVLHAYLEAAVADADADTAPPAAIAAIGNAYMLLNGLRAKCAETVARLAADESPGPEISVDKWLLSTAERTLLDAIRSLLWPALEIDDDDASVVRRYDWMYSRATSIFGGAAEVQLDIIAERMLGLPRGRAR